MGDGRLNICKECVKKRVSIYEKTPRGKEVDKKRNQKPERKKWTREFTRKQRKKWKKKRKCQWTFWNQFRYGTIKKLPCQKCKTKELVEAHHPDYNKPFRVTWLCSLHHKEWHRHNESKNNT